MRKNIRCGVAMLCALGMAGGSVAAGNSSLAPLTPIVQSNQAQQGATVTERKMGICLPIGNMPSVAPNLTNVIAPLMSAYSYFRLYEHQIIPLAATVTILQNPTHGVLRLVTEADRGTLFSRDSGPLNPAVEAYAYIPEQGYLGNDSVTILVDIGGKTVKEVYYFKVVDHPVNNDGDREICKNGPFWKISGTVDANGNRKLNGSS